MNTTPVSLLERLRRPNEQLAWARFVELYTPLLCYWARTLGVQDHDAMDLVQDVFMILLRKLPEFTYDRHKSFRGWLRTVLINKWRDNLRRRGVLPMDPNDAALADVAEPDATAELADTEYTQHLVARALELMQAEFQPTTWKACWEHVVCGRPAREVAAELGIREGTVYSAKCRVISRLRRELDGLLD